MRGWQVPAYPLPPDQQDVVIQRVLVRHGIGRDAMSLLAADIRASLKRLTVGAPADVARTGFHH